MTDIQTQNVDRIEIINKADNDLHIGKLLTLHKKYDDFKHFEIQLQDDGKTLKIFLS